MREFITIGHVPEIIPQMKLPRALLGCCHGGYKYVKSRLAMLATNPHVHQSTNCLKEKNNYIDLGG